MRRTFGPRFVLEAAALVAAPAVAVALGAHWPGIIGATAVTYLLVLLAEAALGRDRRPAVLRAGRREPRQPEAPLAQSQPVAPEPDAARPPEPEAGAGPEHVRVLPRAEPEPSGAPEPAVAPPQPEPEPSRPALAAVPAPPPEPEPVAEPEPEPAEPAARVVPIGVGGLPRQWNVWELERLARDHAGDDAVRDEERSFLLLYLRDFADPSGVLPEDFDGLVRDSFGELVGS
jgi:hypothetical protein